MYLIELLSLWDPFCLSCTLMTVKLFPDDTKLYREITNMAEATNAFQSDLCAKTWRPKFNQFRIAPGLIIITNCSLNLHTATVTNIVSGMRLASKRCKGRQNRSCISTNILSCLLLVQNLLILFNSFKSF